MTHPDYNNEDQNPDIDPAADVIITYLINDVAERQNRRVLNLSPRDDIRMPCGPYGDCPEDNRPGPALG